MKSRSGVWESREGHVSGGAGLAIARECVLGGISQWRGKHHAHL